MSPKSLSSRVEEQVIEFVEAGKPLPELREETVDVNPRTVSARDMQSPQVIG